MNDRDEIELLRRMRAGFAAPTDGQRARVRGAVLSRLGEAHATVAGGSRRTRAPIRRHPLAVAFVALALPAGLAVASVSVSDGPGVCPPREAGVRATLEAADRAGDWNAIADCPGVADALQYVDGPTRPAVRVVAPGEAGEYESRWRWASPAEPPPD